MRRKYVFYNRDKTKVITVYAYSYTEAQSLFLKETGMSKFDSSYYCDESLETPNTCSGSVSPYLK